MKHIYRSWRALLLGLTLTTLTGCAGHEHRGHDRDDWRYRGRDDRYRDRDDRYRHEPERRDYER